MPNGGNPTYKEEHEERIARRRIRPKRLFNDTIAFTGAMIDAEIKELIKTADTIFDLKEDATLILAFDSLRSEGLLEDVAIVMSSNIRTALRKAFTNAVKEVAAHHLINNQ